VANFCFIYFTGGGGGGGGVFGGIGTKASPSL
jgi:hypothetical protein